MHILLILMLAFAFPARAQVAVISDEYWDSEFIPVLENTESIIFDTARWEPVDSYSEESGIRRLASPVGRMKIRHPGRRMSLCTAFLIETSIIMTNNHCLPGGARVTEAVIEFGYLKQFDNERLMQYNVQLTPLYTDRNLDFSLLRVDGEPGNIWGTLNIEFRPIKVAEALQVYHHPRGQPMRLSRVGCMAGPATRSIPRGFFLHQCDTLGGSSGAPIIDERGTVVGIHHRGTVDRGIDAFNQGTVALYLQQALDTHSLVREAESPPNLRVAPVDGGLSALRQCADEARAAQDEEALLSCLSLREGMAP